MTLCFAEVEKAPHHNHTERDDVNVSADPATNLPSRRKLLAAAAWTVPVIATVTATPAFAASQSVVSLEFTHFTAWKSTHWVSLDHAPWGYQALDSLAGNLGVQEGYNQQPAVLVTSIVVIISVPRAGMSSAQARVGSGSSSGWQATSTSVSADTISYSFLWTGSISSDSGSRAVGLNFELPATGAQVENNWFPKTLTAVATSATANSASSSAIVSN